MRTCTKENCENRHYAHGLCGAHYQRARAAEREKKGPPEAYTTYRYRDVLKGRNLVQTRRTKFLPHAALEIEYIITDEDTGELVYHQVKKARPFDMVVR